MNNRNWNYVNEELNKIYFEIFEDVNINDLDNYTKRKIIFEYLCKNIKYDHELLEKIKKSQLNSEFKISRDPFLEVDSIFKYKKGICNAIAQVYKLLLEKVDIYSLCVICDDGTSVNHQLNLIYDDDTDTFSFDDVTSVIVNRGNMDTFFDYDIDDANKNSQGNKPVFFDKNWVYLPDEYINFVVGRSNEKKSNYKIELSNSYEIPTNIVSNKKRTKTL